MSHHPHAAPSPQQARIGLAIHAAAFVVVNAILVVVDLQSSGNMWFQWPLLGWGAGLACHAWVVHKRVGMFGSSAEGAIDGRRDV